MSPLAPIQVDFSFVKPGLPLVPLCNLASTRKWGLPLEGTGFAVATIPFRITGQIVLPIVNTVQEDNP